jgi:hypothetical protein
LAIGATDRSYLQGKSGRIESGLFCKETTSIQQACAIGKIKAKYFGQEAARNEEH